MTTPISRRDAILRTFAFSAAALIPASALLACGKKELVCNDTAGLTPDEITARTNTFKYVDQSTDQTKLCEGCQQYKPAPMSGACGGCVVMKGAIHPKGGCTVWAKKVSLPPSSRVAAFGLVRGLETPRADLVERSARRSFCARLLDGRATNVQRRSGFGVLSVLLNGVGAAITPAGSSPVREPRNATIEATSSSLRSAPSWCLPIILTADSSVLPDPSWK
jgi:hypothetical protein